MFVYSTYHPQTKHCLSEKLIECKLVHKFIYCMHNYKIRVCIQHNLKTYVIAVKYILRSMF